MTEGAVSVVTGGGSGVGLATALSRGRSGGRVVICGRDARKLEAARRRILDHGAAACESVTLDLANAEGPDRLVELAADRFGRIDLLVNSAAVAPRAHFTSITDASFDDCLAVNVAAVFRTTRAVWPVMERQGGGVIVNVSSLASIDPYPGFEVYGASKAWVNLFTEATAREGVRINIFVFALCLGAVETPMLRRAFPEFAADQTLDPNAVAEFIERLCDPAMQHASGQSLRYVKR
jgi:NAD(P)-dependent dehydrogenase (short-subunit alcohol dehydrogenase family)